MPSGQNILTKTEVRLNTALSTTAGTLVTGAIVDMANWDSVCFFCTIATVNAGNFIKVQQGKIANMSDAADLEGSAVIGLVDADVVATEVFRPVERYVRPLVVRAGADTVLGEIYAIRVGNRTPPVDNNVASLVVSGTIASPDEGTA